MAIQENKKLFEGYILNESLKSKYVTIINDKYKQ